MKKILSITIFTFVIFFCYGLNVFAYSSKDYESRSLCGTYELASFKSDGSITKVDCFNYIADAKAAMYEAKDDTYAIMARVNGKTKIIEAYVGLLDLSVYPDITYFYRDEDLDTKLTYMDVAPRFGSTDGVMIQNIYNHGIKSWAAQIMVNNSVSWIPPEYYEVVPITWVKSTSTYTVTSTSIRHNYIENIKEKYTGSKGTTIGPKPDMLPEGTYYSYDGHYFYTDLKKLILDTRARSHENAINKDNPYYNYYMYLSNHSRTNYSSLNINDYVRNNLDYSKGVYGRESAKGTSRLYGYGEIFYYAQEKYGVNALLTFSLNRHESGNGTSKLAVQKNNGFGLNAVDSNPIQAANWFATYGTGIMEYASVWLTYGYLQPTDWRYFGPQFGNKGIGMNVKYASDIYWGEKVAAKYYNFDKNYGLQDYNYYQLGVLKGKTYAKSSPSSSASNVYRYPEAEDAVLIVDEIKDDDGNVTWYKVMSDINLNSKGKEVTSGDYNWNSYVYLPATSVRKINTPKDGLKDPSDAEEYIDSHYTYDLYDKDNEFKPKVATLRANASCYEDAAMQKETGGWILKDKYVMVYAAAFAENGEVVSYLVTDDYKTDQHRWVAANKIKFITSQYAYTDLTELGDNEYNEIYPSTSTNQEDISGQYTYSYIPVLETKTVDGQVWYKVPVSLRNNRNEFGWMRGSYRKVTVTISTYTASNNSPTITAKDITTKAGIEIDLLEGVSATDPEDGAITPTIKESNLDITKVGTYRVTYSAIDSSNEEVTKTITVTVIENKKPVINANNITLTVNHDFNPLDNVSATDEEDGEVEVKVESNNVDKTKAGTYQITYSATDKFNQKTTKTIQVIVVENQLPVINANNKKAYLNNEFNPLANVSATDAEDGDITDKIQVIENTVDITKVGEYKVIYQVKDNDNATVTKEIKVTVAEKALQEKEGLFYLDYFKKVDNKLTIKGYQTISGIDNNLSNNISYKLLLINIDNDQTIEQEMTRITNKSEITRPVYSVDGKDYTYSWFKYSFNFNDIPEGNYRLYVLAESDDYFSKSLVSNKLYHDEDTSFVSDKSVIIYNNYNNPSSPIELIIRNDTLATKNTNAYYNQFDTYRNIEFKNNKLYLRGLSYSYGMDLSKNARISRIIIFENITNYQRYTYDLDSITTGNYKAQLPQDDKLDKTRAWYDKEIDISNIPKGHYVIYIATSSNVTDIAEFSEKLSREITSTATINNKEYSFSINRERGNRIELDVS